jgi:hypothetical protein
VSGGDVRRVLSAVLVPGLLLLAAPALATTVLLVRPTGVGAVTSEALVRIHGELISSGFDVELATAEAGEEVRAAFARGRRRPGPDAVLSIVGDDAPSAIEVWVGDRANGRSVVNQTPLASEGERTPAVLAIRAIELLRSSLLEVSLARPAPPPPPVPAAPAPPAGAVTTVRSQRDERAWGVEVGGGVALSVDGVGPALLPVLQFDRVLAPFCVAQVGIAGLGSRAHIAAPPAAAEMTEQFALAGASFRLRPHQRVRPWAALAAGVLHTQVEGHADWPYRERSASQWSFLADLGLGVAVAISRRYDLSFAAHAQLAEPYPVVSFLGSDVASAGRPTLWFTLTLVAWL